MRRDALAFALIASVALGLATARAEEPGPVRGKTYTTQDDVTRVTRRESGGRTEIYILRGNEKKADSGVVVKDTPEAKEKEKAEPAKTRKARRWRKTHESGDE